MQITVLLALPLLGLGAFSGKSHEQRNTMSTVSGACSCDCCQVEKMLPTEFVALNSGGQVTSKCSASAPTSGAAACSNECQAADNKVLQAARGDIDYKRFCHYNCQPVADQVGSACVQFSQDLVAQAASAKSGNGKEMNIKPLLGLGSGLGSRLAGQSGGVSEVSEMADGTTMDAEQNGLHQAGSAMTKAAVGAGQQKLKVVYDMRKLISERMRAEAGAAMSAAALSAEQARLNVLQAKEERDRLKKLSLHVAQTAAAAEAGVFTAAIAQQAAVESERRTSKVLAVSAQLAKNTIQESRELADAAIKKALLPGTKAAAENRMSARGMDKPQNWDRVVAARAANPYQEAVATAVQRVDEYKRFADGLSGEARAAQQQAAALAPHANIMEAQGDTVEAKKEKKQVSNLLARANALQKEAQGAWNTASSTQSTIPKWQEAAQQAATYAAWQYKNNGA